MNINWKVRMKNPVFWWQIGAAVILPVLAYGGLTIGDINTWGALWHMLKEAMCNPYVLGLVAASVWQTVNDPTTTGLSDSMRALGYTEPNDVK